MCFILVIKQIFFFCPVKGDDPPAKVTNECYKCAWTGGIDGKECAINPRDDNKCTAAYCYTLMNKGYFSRGCVASDDPFIQTNEQCEQKKGNCMLCNDRSMCNNYKLTQEKCYEITYTIDAPIIMNDTNLKACPSKSLLPLGCYHMEKNNKIVKGCMSDLDDDTQVKYRNDTDCEICTTDKCNSMVVRQLNCSQCSQEKDINCAEPSAVQKKMDCSHVSSSCLVGIDKSGITHRVCGTADQQAKDKYTKFELCYGNLCNDQIYPRDRLRCVQCQGDADCALNTPDAKKKLSPKVCETYSDKDECYTYHEEGNSL